ncbi:hypothetical protein [Streptomyces thermovulgaris]|jgi:hypothetical protein|uniref:hypothetical protein n=1 Tax=Streptomyces thermovulgaris TaxID=1934 RepID=UPI003CCC0C04
MTGHRVVPGVELEKTGAGERPAEGCLVTAIRLPVRIVVLVLVVPVRMAWDVLVAGGRFLRDTVLRPVGRGLVRLGRAVFVWPWVALWRHVAVPVGQALLWLGRALVVVPLVWVYRQVLTPVGHALVRVVRTIGLVLAAVGAGVLAGACWAGRVLFVVPVVWLYTWVLVPVGRGIAWCARGLWWLLGRIAAGIRTALYWTGRVLFVLPALALWQWVLVPLGRALAVVGREIADALGHAWRVAGRISLVVGRFLGTLFRWIFVQPLRWLYRTVLTPVGHVVRDAVLRPAARTARHALRIGREAVAVARETVRRTRADLRKALFGAPRPPARREPVAAEARTLEKGTERETSPSTRG